MANLKDLAKVASYTLLSNKLKQFNSVSSLGSWLLTNSTKISLRATKTLQKSLRNMSLITLAKRRLLKSRYGHSNNEFRRLLKTIVKITRAVSSYTYRKKQAVNHFKARNRSKKCWRKEKPSSLSKVGKKKSTSFRKAVSQIWDIFLNKVIFILISSIASKSVYQVEGDDED